IVIPPAIFFYYSTLFDSRFKTLQQNHKIQSELDMANKANKDKAQAVEAATKKVNDATVAAAQAKANLDKSQSERAKAQAALAALENSKTEVLNIIQVPKEYTLEGLKAASEDNNATFEAISESGIDLNKKFNYSQADVNEKVDYQHLTHEQLVEINKYAISLINQMREHFGLKDLILNEEGLKITKTIADGYQAKRESIMKGNSHDKELLDKRAENIGSSSVYDTVRTNIPAMQVKAAKDVSYREYNSNYISISTMADLKANIYTAILALFFDDSRSNYGHALSFLNEHYKYVAVAPSVIDGRVDNYPGYGNAYINFLDWHFVFPGYTTWNDGKYTYYSGNENDKLNPAQDIDLSKATVNTTAAKAELDKKQEAYNAAKTENDKAVATLKTAKAELDKVSNGSTSDVKKLQSNLAQAKQELKDINNKLANAEQNGTTLKQQELQAANTAKEALKNLQAKKVDANKANKELVVAQANVEAAQKAATELNNKVAAVRQELTELNDLVGKGNKAQAELSSLQTKVEAAKENVKAAQKVLDKANEELNLAKVEATQTAQALDKAKTELDQAVAKQQVALDNYNKALNSQKISQEVDRNIQKQTEEKKENKVDSGKKSEFTSNKVIKEAKTNVKEANTFKKQHVKEVNTFKKQHVSVSKASVLPATQLPQTGNKTENQSIWGLVSLAIAGMLGLVGYNKQKKNN
ncbi:SEC10/PgrA surface exclusion domain-containing protein, partial [Ligilactobacillus salivarius]|uniref:SEC10/PgrA surface exclusion domain-containing protein n=1 Tax=Ligilactobacillus salivarius TaxID=1624 RepID=UPI003F223BB6